MQIVIEIDEEDFALMKHNIAIDNPLCPLSEKEMVSKVANGTPLPKGHGRLIDGDKLYAIVSQYSDNEGAVDGNKGDDENYLIHKDSILEIIETRETVIPAEKEDD